MATPTACTIYTTKATFVPWNESLATQHSSSDFRPRTGPHGSPCPGQVRPFNPTLVAGTGNAEAGGFSSFSLKLNREDGDQYLGHLNFTMPPGLTANLHGITYCPEASIAQAAKTLGRTEQADPSCPAAPRKSAPQTSPPAPANTPSTPSARSTSPDPSRAHRSRSW